MLQQGIVFFTLILVLALFMWGRIRHDLVALLALFILILACIIDPGEAFYGLGEKFTPINKLR